MSAAPPPAPGAIAWRAGERALRDLVARALAREAEGEVLHDSARRRVVRVRVDDERGLGHDVVLKRFRARRPLREALARALGRAQSAREWRALAALARARAAVPEPLALLRDARGDVLATRFVPGVPLARALAAAAPAERARIARAVAEALRAAHAAGFAHGDLHQANVRVDGERVWILDWQRARRARTPRRGARADAAASSGAPPAPQPHRAPPTRAERRDLAALELSLALSGASRATRMRLRRAQLADAATARALRAAGARVDALAHAHFRGRTRRCLREGRRFARLCGDAGAGVRGMRVTELPAAAIARALAAHDDPAAHVLKDDARARVTRLARAPLLDARDAAARDALPATIVAKEVRKGGLARRAADALRGSPARRAWIAGHGLAARGIAAARPLAWIELGARGGAGARSIVLLEDLGGAACLEDAAHPALAALAPERLADALASLLLVLHRRGVDHGDLQASHVFATGVGADGAATRLALIDLEGLRFRRRLSDARRVRALAELNASLADVRLADALRRTAFERYARALPFSTSRERALREVVRLSRARRHRWRGDGCADAASPSLASP